ncbi:hypothetical protein E2562_006508 [Oryza meyeriana var. granulata]|uniref:Uncharacterized protein n=1 Tax=Oryza meyeriana var. granulata TaxID=110450 RepID=A0A6G1CN53_9ORYZ|nr:hypothetical protein E2562_006508 [Oryza meyeriana var. granulata]
MRHNHCQGRAALEPFRVKITDSQDETPEQYAIAFGRVNEVLEKMPELLEDKSWVEARFVVAVAVEYIFGYFVSRDHNFHLEPVEEGIQAVSEEATIVA